MNKNSSFDFNITKELQKDYKTINCAYINYNLVRIKLKISPVK